MQARTPLYLLDTPTSTYSNHLQIQRYWFSNTMHVYECLGHKSTVKESVRSLRNYAQEEECRLCLCMDGISQLCLSATLQCLDTTLVG